MNWFARLAIALLVLLSLSAVFTRWENSHRSSIEQVTQPTAVGDTRFVPIDPATRPALTFRNRPLIFGHDTKGHDSDILRVGYDDSRQYCVYRPAHPERTGIKSADEYLLKTANNEYLRATLK